MLPPRAVSTLLENTELVHRPHQVTVEPPESARELYSALPTEPSA